MSIAKENEPTEEMIKAEIKNREYMKDWFSDFDREVKLACEEKKKFKEGLKQIKPCG